MLVEPEHPKLSIVRQCELLGLPRTTYYYQPAQESELNLRLMRLLDERYLLEPSWGVGLMTGWLREVHGYQVNEKRIRRLMRLMGLFGIRPRKKRQTSLGSEKGCFYPNLLKNRVVSKVNECWVSDITYVPMSQGFMYLVVVMDLYSRYVLSWELSNSLEVRFCLDALEKALEKASPEVFHSDKGCQYTSHLFLECLKQRTILPSMTGTGRCWDNIHIERLWWSVKYENIYLREYITGVELYAGLEEYFARYNTERVHQALHGKVPAKVYYA